MKGWPIALAGVMFALFGWLTFPGIPGCAITREDYCVLVVQSVAPSILLMSVGLVVLILGAYKMSQDHSQGRFEKMPKNTAMSDPAWNRTDPNRLFVFCITNPHTSPSASVKTTKTVTYGV
jgi:hypothetical protein